MSTSATISQSLNVLQYGAAELKRIIEENTKRAFYITMALLLLLALYSFIAPVITEWFFPAPKIVKVRLAKITLDALPPPNSSDEVPPPPPANMQPPPSGPAARAGMPVAVPDAEIPIDAKDFANIDEINRASATGGDGNDHGGFADNIGQNVSITAREPEPDIGDFVSVEIEPVYDDMALQRRLVYPEMARRNGIEGVVLIGALIGKDGRIEKTQVIETENEVLNAAALKAVNSTPFTPARQNGQPVRVWTRIPIRFKLR